MQEKGSDETRREQWVLSLEDPVRGQVRELGPGLLDEVLQLLPRTTGDPAFDPQLIASNSERLKTVPEVATGHTFLDRSVKIGLAHVDATFQGDHPKYGIKNYGRSRADGFPPTIVATVDALSGWGLNTRAAQLFRYWLANMVRDDGTIAYYGPSISEYGQLLHTGALLAERAGPDGWWNDGVAALDRIAQYLRGLRTQAEGDDGLIWGVPEADTRHEAGKYFHNNAWAARGLSRYADVCERLGASPSTSLAALRRTATSLAKDTLEAIRRTWPEDPADWWLPPQVEPVPRPERLTGSRIACYTNYRYWPELLSSRLLPADMATRLVDARLSGGGQFCGMTRFYDLLDDWPLADYLYGLWALGRKADFLLSLYGHTAYHQAAEHLTAYESVTLPPGKENAPYCLPCQLVAARAARLLVNGG